MDPATTADQTVQAGAAAAAAAAPVVSDAAQATVNAAHAVAASVTVQPFVLELIVFTKAIIMPSMFLVFVFACALRALIYYTVKREEAFAKEFEKRANNLLDSDNHIDSRSFFVICKRLLEKTYYEMFEIRAIMKRRKADHIMEPSDRIFLVQQGMAYLVKDSLKELKFIKYDGNPPPLMELVKQIFATNPCFTRVFGVLPVGPFNDFLNIIPGLFIVAGIFGTFLGIMQALPELGAMDIRDPESTKLVMDTFLAKIAFSMSTSTVGILLSVTMTVYNNFLSPERAFTKIVDRFERALFRLWSRCDNNRLPEQIPHFDEHRDPIEALATMSIEKGINTGSKRVNQRRDEDSRVGNRNPGGGAPAAAPQLAHQAPAAQPMHPGIQAHAQPTQAHPQPVHPGVQAHTQPVHPGVQVHPQPAHPGMQAHPQPAHPGVQAHPQPAHPSVAQTQPVHPGLPPQAQPVHPGAQPHAQPAHPGLAHAQPVYPAPPQAQPAHPGVYAQPAAPYAPPQHPGQQHAVAPPPLSVTPPALPAEGTPPSPPASPATDREDEVA